MIPVGDDILNASLTPLIGEIENNTKKSVPAPGKNRPLFKLKNLD